MARDLNKLQAEFEEAMSYHQLGQVDEAETRYRKLMKKAPKTPALHNNLGLVLQAQHRIDEAVKQLERAVKLDRQYVDAHSIWAMPTGGLVGSMKQSRASREH